MAARPHSSLSAWRNENRSPKLPNATVAKTTWVAQPTSTSKAPPQHTTNQPTNNRQQAAAQLNPLNHLNHLSMFSRIVATTALLSLGSAAELDGGFNIGVPSIPANCISWNDGCNTCRVVNGVIGGCTMMMCREQGTPFCIAYDYSGAPAVDDKPTPALPPVTDTAETSFCEDSRPQMCRMMCQPPSCPMGQCAMRTDSCCEFTCQAPTDQLDGGFNIGVVAIPPPAATSGYNCCGGGVACGFEHCPALGAGQAGCVRPWAMPNGMNFNTDCATPAALAQPTAVAKPTPTVATSFCEDSRPQMCRMMCQPPSCPMGQCAMRTESCCDFTCQAPAPAEPPAPAPAPTIPAGCVSWHDGCNTCMVQNGQVTACTMMMCFQQATPHCLAFDRDHRH